MFAMLFNKLLRGCKFIAWYFGLKKILYISVQALNIKLFLFIPFSFTNTAYHNHWKFPIFQFSNVTILNNWIIKNSKTFYKKKVLQFVNYKVFFNISINTFLLVWRWRVKLTEKCVQFIKTFKKTIYIFSTSIYILKQRCT